MPDAEATKCMHCKRAEFSLITRRHHCRKCGMVVSVDNSDIRVIMTKIMIGVQ